MTSAKKYPRIPQDKVRKPSVLCEGKSAPAATIEHPRDKPGNIILVHGVNDVGMGYAAAEAGLCAVLEQRLYRRFTPAPYRLPASTDKDKVEPDPDAVYFKRNATAPFDSPVIPFYWGYREVRKLARTLNGQQTDRYGNRLDADLSKGGGPFGNATSNLPDMWNRGLGAPLDPVQDPLRPIRDAPGRMYMVLAAARLACLVAAIRQYEARDTVSIVAHSQGCLLSLLAQAMLLERGERPADTLVLTHPPYSLEERPSEWLIRGLAYFRGGSDPFLSEAQYRMLDGWQSLHARLQTLVNIVQGVAQSKATDPPFSTLNETSTCGAVECRWQPANDRDNRGKVYLYFCPEDMTVALDNMQGIGWQGVPDHAEGSQGRHVRRERKYGRGSDYDRVVKYEWTMNAVKRMPLQELGDGFRQRVFTTKQRPDPRTRKQGPVLVGQAPHDFILRIKGEDDQAHVAASERSHRPSLPQANWPVDPHAPPERQRYGIRTINAEPLKAPCMADMHGNQVAPQAIPASSRLARLNIDERGPCEEVDPITAAIAMTSSRGVQLTWERWTGPVPAGAPPATAYAHPTHLPGAGPALAVDLPQYQRDAMTQAYNRKKLSPDLKTDKGDFPEEEQYKIVRALRYQDGRVMVQVQESLNAARRRWQHEVSPKSFHSVIFDSRENHRRVTAYDVAIGSGKASSDPLFYQYLCALADWRLKDPSAEETIRPGIQTWDVFIKEFRPFYECEPEWRKEIIKGNCDYYSRGKLPSCLIGLSGKLWDIVISETTSGARVNMPTTPGER